MPCWEAKGLLPGRGPAAGFGAGLGPGFGPPGVGAEAAGLACSVGWAGAAGAGFSAGFGATAGFGAAPPGFGALERGAAGAFGAAGRAAEGLAAGAEPPKAERSLRTTGGSTVEEAERTNSPISCNLFNASLEVIPSSLASS